MNKQTNSTSNAPLRTVTRFETRIEGRHRLAMSYARLDACGHSVDLDRIILWSRVEPIPHDEVAGEFDEDGQLVRAHCQRCGDLAAHAESLRALAETGTVAYVTEKSMWATPSSDPDSKRLLAQISDPESPTGVWGFKEFPVAPEIRELARELFGTTHRGVQRGEYAGTQPF